VHSDCLAARSVNSVSCEIYGSALAVVKRE
jgi:hypothetical protein